MATRYCHLQRNNVLKCLTCLLPLHTSFRFRLRDKLMRGIKASFDKRVWLRHPHVIAFVFVIVLCLHLGFVHKTTSSVNLHMTRPIKMHNIIVIRLFHVIVFVFAFNFCLSVKPFGNILPIKETIKPLKLC